MNFPAESNKSRKHKALPAGLNGSGKSKLAFAQIMEALSGI